MIQLFVAIICATVPIMPSVRSPSQIKPRILAIGAAHLDRRGRITGPYVAAASNPGTMHEEVGGGVFNALRNATRHGVTGALLSLRGGDLAGDAVARAVADARVLDLSVTFIDRTTPSYTALLDAEGELIAGFADMDLYETCFPKQMRRRSLRDAISQADAVLCDANIPAQALASLAALADGKPLFGIAISPAKVSRFSIILPQLQCLFMNVREAQVVTEDSSTNPLTLAHALKTKGLGMAIITAGGQILAGLDSSGVFEVSIPETANVADVTGAGDAVAGTTTAYLMQGLPLREAVRRGIAAASLTIASPTVIAPYDDNAFAEALARVPSAQSSTLDVK